MIITTHTEDSGVFNNTAFLWKNKIRSAKLTSVPAKSFSLLLICTFNIDYGHGSHQTAGVILYSQYISTFKTKHFLKYLTCT